LRVPAAAAADSPPKADPDYNKVFREVSLSSQLVARELKGWTETSIVRITVKADHAPRLVPIDLLIAYRDTLGAAQVCFTSGPLYVVELNRRLAEKCVSGSRSLFAVALLTRLAARRDLVVTSGGLFRRSSVGDGAAPVLQPAPTEVDVFASVKVPYVCESGRFLPALSSVAWPHDRMLARTAPTRRLVDIPRAALLREHSDSPSGTVLQRPQFDAFASELFGLRWDESSAKRSDLDRAFIPVDIATLGGTTRGQPGPGVAARTKKRPPPASLVPSEGASSRAPSPTPGSAEGERPRSVSPHHARARRRAADGVAIPPALDGPAATGSSFTTAAEGAPASPGAAASAVPLSAAKTSAASPSSPRQGRNTYIPPVAFKRASAGVASSAVEPASAEPPAAAHVQPAADETPPAAAHGAPAGSTGQQAPPDDPAPFSLASIDFPIESPGGLKGAFVVLGPLAFSR
jgi:hypothetical protein